MKSSTWRVVGIDVGWSHLACVVCDINTEDHDIKTVHADMTDLRELSCNDNECMFEKRDRKAGHLVHHYVEKMHEWFNTADKIVIEAQPITSTHKDVEQLLIVYIKQRYSVPNGRPKDHVKLIAPQSMHNHFNMSYDKATRRLQIVEITKRYLCELNSFIRANQKEHLGDAMGFVLYYVEVLLPGVLLSMKPNPFDKFMFRS